MDYSLLLVVEFNQDYFKSSEFDEEDKDILKEFTENQVSGLKKKLSHLLALQLMKKMAHPKTKDEVHLTDDNWEKVKNLNFRNKKEWLAKAA